ncbi:MAG: fatty acid desaturase [Verrucomicrobiales bacterium]
MFPNIPLHRINWPTTIFLCATFLLTVIGVPIYVWHFGIDLFQIGLFLFYFWASAMSITLGYHRLFSHRAFKAKWPVRLATLLFGSCAFENSALDWSADHRRHHKHVDEEEDPYNINKGFFWAHMGWLLVRLSCRKPEGVNDLLKDRMVMWQHRYTHIIGVVVGLILPAALGYWWDGWVGALGGFLIAGVARVVAVQHSTFFINSLCHTVGKRPYDTRTSARDSWIMAIFTFGEGYHNYHHSFQHDYRNGVKPWQYDPTKWVIWALAKLGLASELRRVAPEKIVLTELREARRQSERKIAKLAAAKADAACPYWQKTSAALHELSEAVAKSYAELEKAVADRVTVSKEVLEKWRMQAAELLDALSHAEHAHA